MISCTSLGRRFDPSDAGGSENDTDDNDDLCHIVTAWIENIFRERGHAADEDVDQDADGQCQDHPIPFWNMDAGSLA